MSCFWNSINKALGKGWNPHQLLDWYKSVNKVPNRVTVSGQFLTRRQRQENYTWVDEYRLEAGGDDEHLRGAGALQRLVTLWGGGD